MGIRNYSYTIPCAVNVIHLLAVPAQFWRKKGSFVQLWSYNAHPYLSLVILKIAGFKTNILYNRRFFLSRCFRRASLACAGWVNATHSLPQCFCFRASCIALLCNQFEKNVYKITKVEPAFWLVIKAIDWHFPWVYRRDDPLAKVARINHSPSPRDLLAFLVFSQHPVWVITPVNQ